MEGWPANNNAHTSTHPGSHGLQATCALAAVAVPAGHCLHDCASTVSYAKRERWNEALFQGRGRRRQRSETNLVFAGQAGITTVSSRAQLVRARQAALTDCGAFDRSECAGLACQALRLAGAVLEVALGATTAAAEALCGRNGAGGAGRALDATRHKSHGAHGAVAAAGLRRLAVRLARSALNARGRAVDRRKLASCQARGTTGVSARRQQSRSANKPGQGLHSLVRAASAKRPAAHSEQPTGPTAAPACLKLKRPVGHGRQFNRLVVLAKKPLSHAAQDCCPSTGLDWPLRQARQKERPPSGW
jgi:hypothetical protein